MRQLILYQDYTRQEVHDIFDPDSTFTPQTGTWGLQGIVQIPRRNGDYVFFVTFGQTQAKHEFDEGVTEDGLIRWQSQPKQRLDDKVIRQLISHDEDKHTIYLFLRTSGRRPYTFLGRLKYLTHDRDREQPVYFTWQILDWQLPEEVRMRMDLNYEHTSTPPVIHTVAIGLVRVDPPAPMDPRKGVGTATYKSPPQKDYAQQDARNRKLGLAGEEQVMKYEIDLLIAADRPDLAQKCTHVAKIEGDGAGYDIRSYTLDGHDKFIEVKTTRGGKSSGFYLSAAEIRFSEEHAGQYYLYRVFDFDCAIGSGKLYVLQGSIKATVSLEPVQFKASVKI